MARYEATVPGSIDELELHVSPAEEKEPADELILMPSTEEEEPGSAELTLEAEGIIKFDEITFDGEDEAEDRIKEAMKAYDDAMDEAAGIRKSR